MKKCCSSCGSYSYCPMHGCSWCGRWGAQPIVPTPKTQKAKGLAILNSSGVAGISVTRIMGLYAADAPLKETAIPICVCAGVTPLLFIRPCPVYPRHGFLDSFPCSPENYFSKVKETWEKMQEADPDGEILVTQFINAKWNAIWTPSLVTFGRGHDGATAGKNTISIPLNGTCPFPPEVLSAAGIGKEEMPYMEAVLDRTWSATQLRAGPTLDSINPNFIPFSFVVKRVIKAEGDLIEWDAVVSKMEKGDIVYHPGGSMCDHYSVHCRIHSVPIMTTFEPKVGDKMLAVGKVERPDPKAVLRGAILGAKIPLTPSYYSPAVALLLTALHHSSAMTGSHGKWLGVGAALMLRLGSIALRGEARHEMSRKGPKPAREEVYNNYINTPLSRHRAGLRRLANIFFFGKFEGSGMGGPKWGQCARALVPLFNSLNILAKEESDEAVAQLVSALNIAVNQAHNGGWWLNKFASQSLFDSAAQGYVSTALEPVELIADLEEMSLSDEVIEAEKEKWQKWPLTHCRAPSISKALLDLSTLYGNPTVEIFLKGKKNPSRRISISPDDLKGMIKKSVEDFFAVPEEGGVKIIAKLTEGDYLLYADKSIGEIKPVMKEKM